MQKHNYNQWKTFIQQIKQSQQKTQQLSKLYIIIHEKVRKTIQSSVIQKNNNQNNKNNIQKSIHIQINQHLQFIKSILLRLANSHEDVYLCKLNKQTLLKYQRHLYQLVDFLKALLIIQNSKEKIDYQQLMAIQRVNDNKQFGLKDQLKKSQERRVRSKSGHRLKININTNGNGNINGNINANINDQQEKLLQERKKSVMMPIKNKGNKDKTISKNKITAEKIIQKQQDYIKNIDQQQQQQTNQENQLEGISPISKNLIMSKKEFIKQFKKSKSSLQQHINNNIQIKGNQVNFKKKYAQNNIQKYLNQRRQFQNLYFCQDFYDKIVNLNDNQKNYKSIGNFNDLTSTVNQRQYWSQYPNKTQNNFQSKIFPQFNIKTKFMKASVKKNILNTVWSAKKQLIQELHQKKLNKMNQINNQQTIQIKSKLNKNGQLYQQSNKRNYNKKSLSLKYLRNQEKSPIKMKLVQTSRERRSNAHTNINDINQENQSQSSKQAQNQLKIRRKSSYSATNLKLNLYNTQAQIKSKPSGRQTAFTSSNKKINNNNDINQNRMIVNSAAMKTFRTTWWSQNIENANNEKLRSTLGGNKFGHYKFFKNQIKY